MLQPIGLEEGLPVHFPIVVLPCSLDDPIVSCLFLNLLARYLPGMPRVAPSLRDRETTANVIS